MQPLPEHADVDAIAFTEIRAAARPAVLRRLVEKWPAVAAGRRGELAGYLAPLASAEPVPMLRAPPEQDGLLH